MFLAAAILTGCGEWKHRTPPKQAVQDSIAAAMPSFLSLVHVDLEPIPAGAEIVKVNFKATATPKENLYKVAREVQGTPKVTLLWLTQSQGTKLSIYGYVLAQRTLDNWTLAAPVIETALNQTGNPRGAFGPESYVTDSTEAATALEQQQKNADMQEQERKNTLERQQRERIALEESKVREEQSLRELQERADLAREAAQKETATRRKIEDEKNRIETQKRVAKEHVDQLDRQALTAAKNAQNWVSSPWGAASADTKYYLKAAADAKNLAEAARKEYNATWGSSTPLHERERRGENLPEVIDIAPIGPPSIAP